MTPPDTPTITAEALDRLEALAAYGRAEATRNDMGRDWNLGDQKLKRGDLDILLAIARRALASGAGGDGPVLFGIQNVDSGNVLRSLIYETEERATREATKRTDNYSSYRVVPLYLCAHQPPEPKPAPDHGALVVAASWFATHRKHIESDIRSAHSGRGNATTQRMTEDDNDFRGELRLAFDRLADALASAPSGGVGEQFAENAKCSELAAENARLREALQAIDKEYRDHDVAGIDVMVTIARTALAPTDGGTK